MVDRVNLGHRNATVIAWFPRGQPFNGQLSRRVFCVVAAVVGGEQRLIALPATPRRVLQ